MDSGPLKPMNRKELETYLIESYGASTDFPWAKWPDYEVFRHADGKWFAVIMNISASRLEKGKSGEIDIVNFKCGSIMSGSLTGNDGIFPAYHMNKENWVSVALDGRVPDEMIKMLADISFDMTAQKPKAGRKNNDNF